jgi:DNA-binding MarR family transcriptional regulator
MTDRRERSIADILELQRTLGRAFHAAAGPHLLLLDLTMAQLKTLIVLADEGPVSIGQVAELLRVGLPTASHLVDRLVRAGLATREEDPADRRRTLTRLTPAGEELVARVRQGSQDQWRGWLSAMSDADLAALTQGLQALVQAARVGPATPELAIAEG